VVFLILRSIDRAAGLAEVCLWRLRQHDGHTRYWQILWILHQVVRIAVVGPDKYPEARRLKSSGGWL